MSPCFEDSLLMPVTSGEAWNDFPNDTYRVACFSVGKDKIRPGLFPSILPFTTVPLLEVGGPAVLGDRQM